MQDIPGLLLRIYRNSADSLSNTDFQRPVIFRIQPSEAT